MNEKLKVSILCITCLHEKFIRQALESFVMQKADFVFEVIESEDCSPDNTKESHHGDRSFDNWGETLVGGGPTCASNRKIQ